MAIDDVSSATEIAVVRSGDDELRPLSPIESEVPKPSFTEQIRVRHQVLGLLMLLSVVTYMDRICISVASTRIRDELGITVAGWGWVLGAFTLAYGAFEIPSGALGDRFGQRRVLTRIVVWWSAFTALTGTTSNYFSLLVTRFLFGAGEAGAYPNATGSIRRWFPVAERARAQGFVWGASRIGGALTPIVVVPLVSTIGWRAVFYLFAAFGCLWAVVWRVWYRDQPSEHASVTKAELVEIGPQDATSDHAFPWNLFAVDRQLWRIMAMFGCYTWGSTFYIAWLSEFLTKGRGLSDQQMAVFASLPFLMGAAGNVAGGFLSDRWSRKYGPKTGRVALGSACLMASALLLFATAFCPNPYLAVALLTLGFGIMDCMLPCAWAVCLDVGGKHAGAVSGAMNTAGQIGSFACAVLFGHLVSWCGTYDIPLLLIAAMVFISSILFTRIDPTRPIAWSVQATKEQECV